MSSLLYKPTDLCLPAGLFSGYARVLYEVPPLPILHHGPWSCLFGFFLTHTLSQLPLYRISLWDTDGPGCISSFLDLPGDPCYAVHSSPPKFICGTCRQAPFLSQLTTS